MPLHIGIVGGSAEGAVLCYRTICVEGSRFLGPYAHPEVSIHTPPLAKSVLCLERGEWDAVGELMLASVRKLATIGADFLICPDNTFHQALPYVAPRSPLPWLHIAGAVVGEAVARGFRRLGLIGTRWLVESQVYPEKLQREGWSASVRPPPSARKSTASLWRSWFTASSGRRRSLTINKSLPG